MDRLQQAMAFVGRYGGKLAVVYIDLDGFKNVNDNYGHQAGDQLLITASLRMKDVLREGDTISRMGGDEFVAVFADLKSIESCISVINRLLASVSKHYTINAKELSVSASIGVTFYPQEGEMKPDQLLRQADQAMYQAKLDGKNCYRVFDAESDRIIHGRDAYMEQAANALKNDEFLLLYQPKVNMATREVVGAEGLIRWRHPDKGMLLPENFDWAFENNSFAIELGEWVISKALVQIELWQRAGLNIPISVNVSQFHLSQASFVPRLTKLLAAYPGVEPQWLELQVLETSEADSMSLMYKNMAACRIVGVSFSLDDFGTGYSSLSHLKNLPVTTLKIDQGIIKNILENSNDLAIVNGIIGLAKALDLSVIAEGVETREVGLFLQKLGCDLAQGFAISEAISAEEWPAWLLTRHRVPLWADQKQDEHVNKAAAHRSVR